MLQVTCGSKKTCFISLASQKKSQRNLWYDVAIALCILKKRNIYIYRCSKILGPAKVASLKTTPTKMAKTKGQLGHKNASSPMPTTSKEWCFLGTGKTTKNTRTLNTGRLFLSYAGFFVWMFCLKKNTCLTFFFNSDELGTTKLDKAPGNEKIQAN